MAKLVCDICEKEGEAGDFAKYRGGGPTLCAECDKECENNYAFKCASCGSYGFIPKNEKNAERVKKYLALGEVPFDESAPVIVTLTLHCRECFNGSEFPDN